MGQSSSRKPDQSGDRPDDRQILLELIQQLAGFPDGEVLWYMAVKLAMRQILPMKPFAADQVIDYLELAERKDFIMVLLA